MSSIFSANEPTLGYLFQIRYSLLLMLLERDENAKLLIEQIDDISIDTIDSRDVYQTKYHVKTQSNLTNASSDLWKTLRVWCEGIKNGILKLDNCIFNLITTQKASKGSIPYNLIYSLNSKEKRDVNTIQSLLIKEAKKKSNKTNNEAYKSFLSLKDTEQKKLIEKINIFDSTIDILNVKDSILKELIYVTYNVLPLFERLEGWFISEVILQLQYLRNEITLKEIRAKILDIADRLKSDNLPNDFNKSIVDNDEQISSYSDQIFVKQMELIGANQKLINYSISDYHRAFSQKSRWMREGLITGLDDVEYDSNLIEDWGRKFSIISDSIISDTDEMQKNKGYTFYTTHYVTNTPKIFIRERFKEDYMVLGSYHILSNKRKVGWHPNFKNKI